MAGPDCRRGVMVAVCGFCFGLLAERIGVSYAVFMIKKFDKTWLRNRWRKAYTKAVLAGRQSVFCSAGMPNVPFWIAKRHVWHSHLACFASRNDPFQGAKRAVLQTGQPHPASNHRKGGLPSPLRQGMACTILRPAEAAGRTMAAGRLRLKFGSVGNK